jgi:programmed cell death protein 5
MMSMPRDNELDMLRQQRRAELQREIQQQVLKREEQEAQHQEQLAVQEQVDTFIRLNLSSEAKTRLTQLTLANAANAEKIKIHLVKNIQEGNLTSPVTDEQFKTFLESISKSRRDTSIRRI